MDLSCLLPLIGEHPEYQRLLEQLKGPAGAHQVVVLDAARPFLAASLYRDLARPLLIITSHDEHARRVQDQVQSWLPAGGGTPLFFPEYEEVTDEEDVHGESNLDRLRVLAGLSGYGDVDSRLRGNGKEERGNATPPLDSRYGLRPPARGLGQASGMTVEKSGNGNEGRGNAAPPVDSRHGLQPSGMGEEKRNGDVIPSRGAAPLLGPRGNDVSRAPLLIVVPAGAVAGKVPAPAVFGAACLRVKANQFIDPVKLMEQLVGMGYEAGSTVEVPGAASRRGGIVDFFSPHSELPVRIDFFGNRIETIRTFDPKNQRSVSPVTEAMAVPAKEPEGSPGASILDYLPPGSWVIVDGPEGIAGVFEDEETADLLKARIAAVQPRLTLATWGGEGDVALPFVAVPFWGGQLEPVVKDLGTTLRDRARNIVVSHQAKRLSEYFGEHDLMAAPVTELCAVPPVGSLTLVQGSLDEGWAISGSVRILTDKEIFGFVKQRRQVQKRPVHWQQFLAQLSPGDYVVHVEHGIGKFAGIVKQSTGGVEREFLALDYGGGDRLYVPTDRIDRVSRYVGAGDTAPTLNRLGNQEWAHTRKKVKEAAEVIAKELLELYAAREASPGHSFGPDTPWQQEMEAAFPYVETADQLAAVNAVKEDMEKPRAMDRLICGDVGYGKTEVALRAAFKAVMDGKQVAVLVPTTILAQQHFMTFSERLRAYPVKVAMLSRFVTDEDQERAVENIKLGEVDVVIGTHRLLQKDVVFKDLGLVVIDEEQRFGVSHKERLKQMKREVDVLSLSATPIPRTLYMSMVGVKDMSTIETPPDERLPIKTHVGPFDEMLIKQAILREKERGGQVFVVHNRVQSIGGIAHKLNLLLPQARILVGHGQMPEEQLEDIMAKFSAGEADVLCSTTIIESGLDMPNVNTLIVTDSERLGLTQLHQLRGRVGRGVNRAFAYFMYPRDKRLTQQAVKRLKTIFEVTELGAGFGIALRDLEIRGAGNLLGTEQSGHIAAVGFDLYCRLLGEAVAELKAGMKEGTVAAGAPISLSPKELPSADLPVTAYVPDEYVPDANARVSMYYRLSRLESVAQVGELRQELKDRFGSVPGPVENLLYIMEVRLLARDGGISGIAWERDNIALQLTVERRQQRLALNAAKYKGRLRIGTGQIRLDTRGLGQGWPGLLKELVKELGQ